MNRLDITYDAATQSLIVRETGSFGGIGVTFAGTYVRSGSASDLNITEPVQSDTPSDADVAAALAEIMPAVVAVPGQWTISEWGTVSITPQSAIPGAFSISGSVDIMMAETNGSWFAETSDNNCTITYNYAGEYYEDAANQRGFIIGSTVKIGGEYATITVTPLDFTRGGSDPTGMDYSCYLEPYAGDNGAAYILSDANNEIAIFFDESMEPISFSYEF